MNSTEGLSPTGEDLTLEFSGLQEGCSYLNLCFGPVSLEEFLRGQGH